MARRDLLAGDRSGTFANANTSYIYGSIYTALHTGIADRVVVRAGNGSGEVKFSLYDSSGNLLFSDETGSAIGAVSDWVNFDGYNVSISDAVVYRLGVQGNNSGTFTRTDTTADTGFITSHAYADPFPDPISLAGARDYEAAIEFSGFIAPSIINIDGDNSIATTQTSVVLAGLDLSDSAGNATLTLWENSNFTGASQLQTWNSQTDTTLNFDVVQGSLSAGTVYAEVETALGQSNATGFAVTLESSGGASDTMLGATYEYSGTSITASSVSSDTMGGHTLEYSGTSIEASASISRTDVMLGAEYGYLGHDVEAVSVSSSEMGGAAYSYAGLSLSAASVSGDSMIGAVYGYASTDVVANSVSGDTALGYILEYHGMTLNVELVYGVNDTMLGAVYSYSGPDVGASSESGDTMSGATLSYSGLDLEANSQQSNTMHGLELSYAGTAIDASGVLSDIMEGHVLEYSGADIDGSASGSRVDTMLGGVYSYEGMVLIAYPGVSVAPLGTIVLNNINNPIILNNNMDAIILNNNGGGS